MRSWLVRGCFLFAAGTASAQVDINGGMTGSWYDPALDSQGVLIDVFRDEGVLFAAWFTFEAEPDTGRPTWLTLQGRIAQNVAELTVYRSASGRFAAPATADTTAIGQATLEFHSCTSATFSYQLTTPETTGTQALSRLSPDLFCEQIVADQVNSAPGYNLPPNLSQLAANETDGDLVRITYSVADPEDDAMDVQVEVIDQFGKTYQIPEAHLRGSYGYPVLSGQDKVIEWLADRDPGRETLAEGPLQVRLIADDQYAITLQDIVDLVSEDRLVEDVERLQGVRHSNANPAQLENARNYIRSQMIDRQLPVSEQTFTWVGSQGVNLIASLAGAQQANAYYIVDGHYDTVIGTPGADDNASGTAGMLEVMRVLSQFNVEREIRFVGFDKEEVGLRGSRHYAANLPVGESVLGLINFEMIGYTCRDQPECVNMQLADTSIYNIRSNFADTMSNAFVDVAQTHVPQLKVVSVSDDGDPNLRRSDHAPFWDIGVDALFLTDGANFRTPHYHQSTDLITQMDTEFMAQVVKAAVGTLAKVAGATHSDSLIAPINP